MMIVVKTERALLKGFIVAEVTEGEAVITTPKIDNGDRFHVV